MKPACLLPLLWSEGKQPAAQICPSVASLRPVRLPPPVLPPCSQCEVLLEGEGPWRLPSSDTSTSRSCNSSEGDADVEMIFAPGHTSGSVCLLYTPDRTLFTGDHLAFSNRLQRLTTFPGRLAGWLAGRLAVGWRGSRLAAFPSTTHRTIPISRVPSSLACSLQLVLA